MIRHRWLRALLILALLLPIWPGPTAPPIKAASPAAPTGDVRALQNDAAILGYWSMDEFSGSLTDSSELHADMDPSGSPAYGQPGVFGAAIGFDNFDVFTCVNDRTNVGGSFSAGGWVYVDTDAPASNMTLLANGDWNGYTGGWALTVEDDGDLAFWMRTTQPHPPWMHTSETSITRGQWAFVTGVYDAPTGSLKIFVDGLLQDETTVEPWSVYPASAMPLHMGYDGGLLTSFKGRLDEIFILGRALSDTEVGQLYNGTFTAQGAILPPWDARFGLSPMGTRLWNLMGQSLRPQSFHHWSRGNTAFDVLIDPANDLKLDIAALFNQAGGMTDTALEAALDDTAVVLWDYGEWPLVDQTGLAPHLVDLPDLSINAAQGEIEPTSFYVTNLYDRDLSFQVDVTGLDPTVAGQVTLYAVDPTPDSADGYLSTLHPLAAGDRVTIPALESRQIWVELDTTGLDPGTFSGQVVLTPDAYGDGFQPPAERLSLSIEIHNATLPAIASNFTYNYGGGAHIDALDRHGVNWISMSEPFVTSCDVGSGSIELSFSATDGTVADAQRIGAQLISIYGFVLTLEDPDNGYACTLTWDNTAHRPLIRSYFTQWVDHLTNDLGLSTDDFVIYLWDEPQLADEANLLQIAAELKGLRPNVRLGNNFDQRSHTFIEQMGDYLDIMIPVRYMVEVPAHVPDTASLQAYMDDLLAQGYGTGHLWYMNAETLMVFKQIQSQGVEVWTYDQRASAADADIISPFDLYRHRPWKSVYGFGLDGVAFWGSWYAFEDSGTYPNKGMAAWREGLEDVAWMAHLAAEQPSHSLLTTVPTNSYHVNLYTVDTIHGEQFRDAVRDEAIRALASDLPDPPDPPSDDVLVEAIAHDPYSIDPAITYGSINTHVIDQIYEPLVMLERERTDAFTPMLATGWTVSPDGRTYTFNIRDSVTFHNGNALTAEDVAYTFQRGVLQYGYIRTPFEMFTRIFLGQDVYNICDVVDPSVCYDHDALNTFQASNPDVVYNACVSVTNAIVANEAAGTVTFHLPEPNGAFLHTLAGPGGAIVDKEWTVAQGAWDGDCATWHEHYSPHLNQTPLQYVANGTGPFELSSWITDTEVVLNRNETYWRQMPMWEGGPSGLAYFSQVEMTVVPTATDRVDMLLSGEVDLIDHNYSHRLDNHVLLAYDDPAGLNPVAESVTGTLRAYRDNLTPMEIYASFTYSITTGGPRNYIGSGTLDGNGIPADFFSDVDVRRGFNYAFDWDRYLDEAFTGHAIQSRGPIVQGFMGYTDTQATYFYSPTLALEAFNQAWGGQVATSGFSMTIPIRGDINSGGAYGLFHQILKENIEALDPRFHINYIQLSNDQDYWDDLYASHVPLWFDAWHTYNGHPHYVVEVGKTHKWWDAEANIPSDMEAWYKTEIEACLGLQWDEAQSCYEGIQHQTYLDADRIHLVQPLSSYYARAEVEGYYANIVNGPYFYALSKVDVPTVVANHVIAALSFDNDLDPHTADTIEKFRLGTADNPDVRVTLLVDGESDGDTHVLEIANGVITPTTPTLPWLTGVTELDTGDANALAGFLTWARDEHLAVQTTVALVGHGIGPSPEVHPPATRSALPLPQKRDATPTDVTSGTYLSTPELGRALAAATDGGTRPFDVLFLDSCFGANLDVLYEIKDSAGVFIASPNYAWAAFAYDRYLPRFTATATPEEIANAIVGEYHLALDASHPNAILWMRASDIDAAASATSALGDALHAANQAGHTQHILNAVFASRFADTTFCSNDLALCPPDELVDLRSFATALQAEFNGVDATVVTAAGDVLTTLSSITPYYYNGFPWLEPFDTWWSFSDPLASPTIIAPLTPTLTADTVWRASIYTDTSLTGVAVPGIDETVTITRPLAYTTDGRWDDFIASWYGDLTPTVGQMCYAMPPSEPDVVEPTVSVTLNTTPGFFDIALQWNATDSPDVTAYRVRRVIPGTSDSFYLTTTDDTSYTDDLNLAPGAIYCYAVDALYPGGAPATTSNTACTPLREVELWMPEAYAAPGSTTTIGINVGNGDGLPLAATDIWFDFDSGVILPLSIRTSSFTAGYNWDYTISSNGVYSQTRITAAHPSAPTLGGDETLFWFDVEVIGSEGMTTPLDLRDYVTGVGGSRVYAPDPGVPGGTRLVGLQLTDGTFTTGCAYRPGDLNGDCEVNSADVYTVLWFAVHPEEPPTSSQLSAGDINQNGHLDAGDAAPILYYTLHGRWPTPDGESRTARISTSSPVTLSIDSVRGMPDATVRATLSAQDLTGWAAGEFIITYTPDLVADITAVDHTPLSQGFFITYTAQNELRIAMADGEQHTSEDGALLTFDIHIAPDAPEGATTDLVLSESHLYDIYAQELERPLVWEHGLLQIIEYNLYLPLAMR